MGKLEKSAVYQILICPTVCTYMPVIPHTVPPSHSKLQQGKFLTHDSPTCITDLKNITFLHRQTSFIKSPSCQQWNNLKCSNFSRYALSITLLSTSVILHHPDRNNSCTIHFQSIEGLPFSRHSFNPAQPSSPWTPESPGPDATALQEGRSPAIPQLQVSWMSSPVFKQGWISDPFPANQSHS